MYYICSWHFSWLGCSSSNDHGLQNCWKLLVFLWFTKKKWADSILKIDCFLIKTIDRFLSIFKTDRFRFCNHGNRCGCATPSPCLFYCMRDTLVFSIRYLWCTSAWAYSTNRRTCLLLLQRDEIVWNTGLSDFFCYGERILFTKISLRDGRLAAWACTRPYESSVS
jgi:hypothetical protein